MSAAEPLWLPLGELLVERGLLGQRQLELALLEQKRTGRRLGEVLIDFKFVSGPALASTLLEQVGIAETEQRAPEPEPEPEPEPQPEPAAVPEPLLQAPEPRRAGHLAEAEEVRPVVLRVENLKREQPQSARVVELEALVADFERRSADIQSRIAEVRDVLGDLRS